MQAVFDPPTQRSALLRAGRVVPWGGGICLKAYMMSKAINGVPGHVCITHHACSTYT